MLKKTVNNDPIKILGINFFNNSIDELFLLLKQNGGLMTVPAAPALVNIPNDQEYYASLKDSDFVIPDSGYMVIIWNLFSSPKVNKISGLEFINFFIKKLININDSTIFLVNPSEIEGEVNLKYILSKGGNTSPKLSYTAPYYIDNVYDYKLLQILEETKPSWILINIGGGTQEKLGLFLKKNLSYSPAILCTGAAIAFKTGMQANIPVWADNLSLGWLVRCIHRPQYYIKRYIKAVGLASLILKYKSLEIINK